MKKTNKSNNKRTAHIETFLFCPKVGKLKKPEDPAHLFSNLDDLDNKLADCVVFFNLPSALQYSRFMSRNHVVLRAFVEHTAVEGFGHGLGLKKGTLTKQHIHGCFPGWTKGNLYVENPAFNSSKFSTE